MNKYSSNNAVYLGAMNDAFLLKHKKRLEEQIEYYKLQIDKMNEQMEMAEILIKQIDERMGVKNDRYIL